MVVQLPFPGEFPSRRPKNVPGKRADFARHETWQKLPTAEGEIKGYQGEIKGIEGDLKGKLMEYQWDTNYT